jgi:hypothetical protein
MKLPEQKNQVVPPGIIGHWNAGDHSRQKKRIYNPAIYCCVGFKKSLLNPKMDGQEDQEQEDPKDKNGI